MMLKKKIRIPCFHKNDHRLTDNVNIFNSMIRMEYTVETCTVVIRKKILDEVCEACKYELGDHFMMRDIQYWAEIAYIADVKYINESFATRNLLIESASRSQNPEKKIIFLKNAMDMRFHYARKYAGDAVSEVNKHIAKKFSRRIFALACHATNPYITKEALKILQKYQVPIGFVDYIYFIGSYNILFSYFVRLAAKISKKINRTKFKI